MPPKVGSTAYDDKSLSGRVGKATNAIMERFQDLVAKALVEPDKATYDHTALNTMQIEAETRALIRAAEEVLTLTREMQELWLFGHLDTLGKGDAERQTEEDAKKVTEVLEKLVRSQNSEHVRPTETS
ncbi:hypothetical protein K402DRAFT_392242 [Aulographum hederae CBS 113979]|uniref:Mediator of RNA polymerase II transcription subunit 22 n=1 Tax=Aulographum hederae CBS 113979 TaxID=1176131 RepID=A0A6G1H423_9PEZI|nr:hypothetical protein K402DRAFT_392242 [Aulographum hederae CBS 113979]